MSVYDKKVPKFDNSSNGKQNQTNGFKFYLKTFLFKNFVKLDC